MTSARATRQGTDWSIAAAEDLYKMSQWSDRFFGVAANGHVEVRTSRAADARGAADGLADGLADGPADRRTDGVNTIDVPLLVADLAARGVHPPVLLRFHDVLRERVKRINTSFAIAVADAGYEGSYRCVYPVKVNQLREVVEEILDAGAPFDMGLECGSKAELVAALVQTDGGRLLLCNGVKDDDMLRLLIDAQQLGRNALPVMEKVPEFNRFLELSAALNVPVRFGVRVRLDAGGAGRWAESGGTHSKFGVSIPELTGIAERLVAEGRGDWLRLLHFHIGSQIESIQAVKDAVRELTQIYVQLRRMGLPVTYLDVGGGLGVNYGGGFDGDDESGVQYSLQEYANAIVFTVMEVCDAGSAPHPILVSESGRALTAHHSMLVVDVLDAFSRDDGVVPSVGDDEPAPLQQLAATYHWLGEMQITQTKRLGLLEAYHDARAARDHSATLFNLGYLTLTEKAMAEQLFWAVCRRVWALTAQLDPRDVPGELAQLEDQLADQYLCNFSVFQSMLDHWAIGQKFPIVPLQRLDEAPTRRAVLVDLTCDSDGKVARYVCRGASRFLPVHELRDHEPYRLGVFLLGAYQDILGDAHNLLGRVAEAHVYGDASEPSGYFIERIVPAMTIQDMLALVQYFPNDLVRRMQEAIRAQQELGVLRPREGVALLDRYSALLGDNTYMQPDGGA